jgi:GTPase SAR1 family protein
MLIVLCGYGLGILDLTNLCLGGLIMSRFSLGSGSQTEKVLLMGLAESGKSTIVQVGFEGRDPPPIDNRYDATLEYHRKTVDVDGEKLSIFDVGGQKAFLDRFTGELAEFIFTNVRMLIWVVDLTKLEELTRAKFYFDKCLENLAKYSSSAQVAVFLHKKDMVPEDLEYYVFAIKSALLTNVSEPIALHLTSVYDDSLFEAIRATIAKGERTPEQFQSLIVSFHAKTQARSVEVVSLSVGSPLTRVGDDTTSSVLFGKFNPTFMEVFSTNSSEEPSETLTGAILETETGLMVWRKIDADLVLTASFPKDAGLLEIYPSLKTLISRLGTSS